MNNVMTNGFTEHTTSELTLTDGGGWWSFWEGVGSSFYQITHPDIYGHNNGGGKGLAPDPKEFNDYRCI